MIKYARQNSVNWIGPFQMQDTIGACENCGPSETVIKQLHHLQVWK